jgi:hypothetical protein
MASRRGPVSPMAAGPDAVGHLSMSSWRISCWAGRRPGRGVLGPGGLLSQETNAVLEQALAEEMTGHVAARPGLCVPVMSG